MAKDPKRRNFAFDSLQVLSGQFVMMAIGIVNGVITARWLGPADRGRFALLVLLPTMLSNFVKLGIPQASVYYMRRRGASGVRRRVELGLVRLRHRHAGGDRLLHLQATSCSRSS